MLSTSADWEFFHSLSKSLVILRAGEDAQQTSCVLFRITNAWIDFRRKIGFTVISFWSPNEICEKQEPYLEIEKRSISFKHLKVIRVQKVNQINFVGHARQNKETLRKSGKCKSRKRENGTSANLESIKSRIGRWNGTSIRENDVFLLRFRA